MSTVMLGGEAAKAMKEPLIRETEELKAAGVRPRLALLRVGERPDDLSYERSARKRMEMIGIDCQVTALPETVSQAEFESAFDAVNEDPGVHGILLFCPLPKGLDIGPVKERIDPRKDVDGISAVNEAKVFSGDPGGFAPCTAQAVIELLDHYGIDLTGKKVTLVGRSLVVGKPLAMLLLGRNATLTICHTRTRDLAGTCAGAEVLIAAAGRPRMITADMVAEGAVVVDVGINVDENGDLCGDVDYEAVEPKASYISPVPRGVGNVTTSVLAEHVLRAARLLNGIV